MSAMNVDDAQLAYVHQRDTLVEAIHKSQTILTDLQELNKSEWVVRYPQLKREKRQKPRRSMTFADDPSKETEVIVGRQGLSRSLTLASIVDAPKSLGDSQSSPIEVAASQSLASLDTVVEGQGVDGDAEEGTMSGTMVETDPLLIPPTESDFHVLRLDLKLNHSSHFTSSRSAPSCTTAASADSTSPSGQSTTTTSPASLVSHLEKSSIASLLGSRISAASAHLTNLEQRVKSPLSKVLVTGDLNAGKSTVVNRLLGREIVPVDQQPCTAAFCEVKDAKENAGVEEVHVCKEGKTYDVKDEETYTRHTLEELDTLATEGTDATMIKVYINDGAAPSNGSSQDSDSQNSQSRSHSLLSNPVTSLALIDAPGLNRDSLKTTALFASHTEIDVILFVVSAENHFTLSAKEFLWTAGREKRYVFVVVNKFGGIRDKERCRGVVGGQVKGLSPGTWEGRGMLVHFVEAGTKGMVNVKGKGGKGEEWDADEAFESMEAKLRKFVLEKRVTSKLLPAKTYLEGLLGDVELLLEANRIEAEGEQSRVLSLLKGSGNDGAVGKEAEVKKMQEDEGGMEDELEDVEECGVRRVEGRVGDVLEQALEMVEQGKLPGRLAIGNTATKAITPNAHANSNALTLSLPEYPGVWSVLQYARDVRRVMLEALDQAVRDVEDEARGVVEEGVDRVGQVGKKVLPEEVERERRRRVFRKEAMFAREKTTAVKKHHKAVHGGGSKAVYRYGAGNGVVGGLGLSLASREELLEVGLEDLFDYREWFGGCFAHHSSHKNKSQKNGKVAEEEDAAAMTALSILGVSLGTLPLVSSHLGSLSLSGLGVSLGAGGLGLGGLMGIRSLFEASVKVVDMIRDEEVRKWIAPVVGAVVLGSVGWVVVELPRSVPRSVGRRVGREVRRDAGAAGYLARVGSGSAKGKGGEVIVKEKDDEGEDVWIKAHTYRITRETRKVLRLAAWDVREKWRGVYDERVKEVRGMEEVVKKCEKAVGRMAVILGRCGEVRQGIVGVGEMAEVGAEEVE
ncbi:mitofusin [Pleurotus ostreatus]|nr:mitofusin [Pleurotus ostreatus]